MFSSQFEEKFEETNGVEVPMNFSSGCGISENQEATIITEKRLTDAGVQGQDDPTIAAGDLNASEDFVGGIMKIVPSEVDVSLSHTFYQCILAFPKGQSLSM